MYSILVTGSRLITDRALVRNALRRTYEGHEGIGGDLLTPDEVLVRHGAQGTYRDGKLFKGADMLADEEARKLGMRTDPQPADWHGPCRPECQPGHRRIGRGRRDYCPAAGNYRNTRLVELGADICLGFPLGVSRGTRDCMRKAQAAGIEVVDCVELAQRSPALFGVTG
jgi:hypothetical protein